MSWTTPTDLKAQVQRLWDRGVLLGCLCGGDSVFPRRLTFKVPSSRQLSVNGFPEVREWIAQLTAMPGFYRIEWRNVKHRVLGTNEIPSAIWVDTLADALGLIGKCRAGDQFSALVKLTHDRQPELVPWLARRPLRALDLTDDWSQLLATVAWLLQHPRPAIYLRQIDLPGIHTKWIEGHRGVLAELLDLVLPETAIDATYKGVGGFCRRYGFLDKPARVRFRVLDSDIRLLPGEAEQDVTLTQDDFATLELPISKVFITENEINFLTFPEVSDAMVIFGAGYGFDNLATADWLQQKAIYYWGDIDTHGFAILNQLRGRLPHTVSFLMDRQTLLDHQSLWTVESQPEIANLSRLNMEEQTLYDQLCKNHWGPQVRLEQERVGFDFLINILQTL